jgi:hypothetical protein
LKCVEVEKRENIDLGGVGNVVNETGDILSKQDCPFRSV